MGNKPPSLTFHIVVDKAEAQHLLNEAEQKDFYTEEYREDYTNALARNHAVYAPNRMTDREFKLFEVVTENAKESVPLRLLHELSTVHIIQLMPSAEGGMPHTRPDAIICYPDINRFFSMSTLIHELWHIHQRQYVVEWTRIFQTLGWEPWQGQLPVSLEANRRLNPDTIDSPLWCFQKSWVPVPVFRDISKPKVTEADVWFYHVTLKYHVKTIPKEMASLSPSLPRSGYEHPREWAAYVLSNPSAHEGTPMFQALIEALGVVALPRGRID